MQHINFDTSYKRRLRRWVVPVAFHMLGGTTFHKCLTQSLFHFHLPLDTLPHMLNRNTRILKSHMNRVDCSDTEIKMHKRRLKKGIVKLIMFIQYCYFEVKYLFLSSLRDPDRYPGIEDAKVDCDPGVENAEVDSGPEVDLDPGVEDAQVDRSLEVDWDPGVKDTAVD